MRSRKRQLEANVLFKIFQEVKVYCIDKKYAFSIKSNKNNNKILQE